MRAVLVFIMLAGLGYAQQPPVQVPVQPAQTTLPNQQQQSSGDVRPIPDPTILTTQALEKSLAALKELLQTRLASMDEATRILQARADKVPSDVDVAVINLKNLHSEKFASIEKQFEERDVRTKQLADASTTAINAALQAAEKAVANQNISNEKAIIKSESTTSKLLELLAAQISDVKERLGAVENKSLGQTDARTTQQADNGMLIAAIGGVVGIISCAIAIGALFLASRRAATVRR